MCIGADGNGCDIGSMHDTMHYYRAYWRVNILLWEYPGYGCCEGAPSEAAINANMQAVLSFVTDTLHWPLSRILLYGQSIGTGPVCWMGNLLNSQNKHIGGIILQSPYTSIKDVVKFLAGSVAAGIVKNRWHNLNALSSYGDPLLIIHGQKDTIIPPSHSQSLYDGCPSSHKHLLIVNQATHNEFDHHLDVISPVQQFLDLYQKPTATATPAEHASAAAAAAVAAALPPYVDVKIDKRYFSVPNSVIEAYMARVDKQIAKASAEQRAKERKANFLNFVNNSVASIQAAFKSGSNNSAQHSSPAAGNAADDDNSAPSPFALPTAPLPTAAPVHLPAHTHILSPSRPTSAANAVKPTAATPAASPSTATAAAAVEDNSPKATRKNPNNTGSFDSQFTLDDLDTDSVHSGNGANSVTNAALSPFPAVSPSSPVDIDALTALLAQNNGAEVVSVQPMSDEQQLELALARSMSDQ